jgi:hypothetical protein
MAQILMLLRNGGFEFAADRYIALNYLHTYVHMQPMVTPFSWEVIYVLITFVTSIACDVCPTVEDGRVLM